MKCAIIFGGNGFIGSFFAKDLLINNIVEKVYLYDNETICQKTSSFRKNFLKDNKNIIFVEGDVRNNIDFVPNEDVFLIANFAAVHREPGHKDEEYYETNIPGAENVCLYAEKIGCNNIIFTSSIAPYNIDESIKDEYTIPVPKSAYGGSKLVAEKIHLNWQSQNSNLRYLTIVRPGVVFGPGEGGNVSRLIKAVINRYFAYMGNKKTRKAGIYVKELCNAMRWVLCKQFDNREHVALFNMSMNPGPSIEDYVKTVIKVTNKRRYIPTIPYRILYYSSFIVEVILKPFKFSHPFSPVRIKKLIRSNNIRPSYLINNEYEYRYSLEEAFSDWKKDCPEEWQ